MTLKKPLVAIFTNHDDDIYCFRLELVQALLAEGYRLLICCPDGPKFEYMARQYDLSKGRDFLYDDPKIDRRGTNVIRDGKLFLHYLQLMRKHRPAVILTYTAKPNVYAIFAARLLGIPSISNVTGFGSAITTSGLKHRLIIALLRHSCRLSTCVMFQNETNMRFALEQGFVKGEYKLIPGSGAALNRFPLQEYPEGGDGISGPTVVFNYIGRILKEKGVDDYLEAAQRIKAKYPKTEFNLIGFIEPTEAHYQEEIEKLEQQGIVVYRGEQDDMLPWIRRSHALIHPSKYCEGMSNALLESAACGRPLITTDNPGCRETVIIGVNGFIFPCGDVDSLVSTLETFLEKTPNSVRKQMGLEGRKKTEREFDRKIVVDAYLTKINILKEKQLSVFDREK